MVIFEGISKRYGVHKALDEVSFTLEKGQVLGLLGQNGAGKSTAMNIMTGCLAPTKGRVLMGGQDVLLSPRAAKRMIGYLPEAAPLYDEMTVQAYLRFACELKEVEKKHIPAHVEMVADKTGLEDVLQRKIGNLSKGYRQRVGVAQALCGTPDVIILDEPTAGLDPRQASELRQLIQSLRGEHTVIFSSHILSEVQSVCDRVLILHHGKVLCDSALEELKNRENKLRAVIACGEGTLMPALRSLEKISHVEVIRGGEPGTTQVLLTVREDGAERELFTLLSALQAPLLRLQAQERSLEEIFLKTTDEIS
ncbi:MAG: ATP-binding cassette domain-containing protein [Clostridia bacterium]|nr:ATP-binding cassette domain-containing protein [Clostridia bacterium]